MLDNLRKLLFRKNNIGESESEIEMEHNSETIQRDIKQITKEINVLDSSFRDMQYNYNAERSKLKYELNRCLFSNVNGLITKPKEYLFSDGVFDYIDDMSVYVKVKGKGLFRIQDKNKSDTGEKHLMFEEYVGNPDLISFCHSGMKQVAISESLTDDFLSSGDFIVVELYVGQGWKSLQNCDLVWVNTRDY